MLDNIDTPSKVELIENKSIEPSVIQTDARQRGKPETYGVDIVSDSGREGEKEKQEEATNMSFSDVPILPFAFCRKCGAKLPEGSVFCNKCGTSITSE